MSEVNFCPYCDAPQHKIVNFIGERYYCKTCKRFYNLEEFKLKCPKCTSTNIQNSDFPAPDGSMVFQCNHCKKMFSGAELLKFNKLK